MWFFSADSVYYDGIGSAGAADWLAGQQDNLVPDPSPIAADNEIINYLGELFDILRYWLAPGYYSIKQAHLITRTPVGA